MTKQVKLLEWVFRLASLLFTSAILIASTTPSRVLAQSTDDPWTVPMNLSQSGFAKNPAFVIDSDGVGHVIWQDDLENYVYSKFDDDQWSAPEMTDLDRMFRLPLTVERTRGSEPMIYTGPNPLFVAGSGQIFAFWITPEGRLLTSKVSNSNFDHYAAWDSVRVISHQAASFAVDVDARGEWHLAFLRTAEDSITPAGMYYTHSRNNGWDWAVPVLLYESPYLRRLDEGEANLSLTTAESDDTQHIFIAWDNRPRKQVLMMQSADGGKSWGQPVQVAGPEPDSGLADPSNIQISTNQDSVVLVWQNGRITDGLLPTCSQIYQYSRDAGATWSKPQPMIENLSNCAQTNKFVNGLATTPESPLYFLTETKSQTYLSAWKGREWSQPQAQSILTGFEEPEIYTQVVYGCHRASLSGERLYIIGCDEGEGGDVWVTSRDVGSNTSLFKLPVWSQLSPVTSESNEVEAVELVSTDDGSIHALFSQNQNPAIYYTYWNGESWSRITPVLEMPEGEAALPVITTGPGNELFLIAPNNQGALYFSRATGNNAAAEADWSKPTQLEVGNKGAIGSVDATWDTEGTLYVAYSVPVNEERGIYLVQSKDHGATWSEPVQVFNGAAAGFDLVGAPSLLKSEDGFLHIIWKQQIIQGDGIPQSLSLFYARSEDGGHTFSTAEPIVKEPVGWQEILTDDKGQLHLLWKAQDSLTTVWDQVSSDGGRTWQYPQGLPSEGGLTAVTSDPAGRLNLVGVGPSALSHWLWDGSRWKSETPLSWSSSSKQNIPVKLLATTINKQGNMMVLLAEPTSEGETDEKNLLYSTRALELPRIQSSTQKDLTPTQLPPTLTPATPTPERSLIPTSTIESEPSSSQGQTTGNESNSQISPFMMALIPVALLLFSVLGIVIWQNAKVKDR